MNRFTTLVTASLVAGLSTGCVEERSLAEAIGSFQVEVISPTDIGAPDVPLPFPETPQLLEVTIQTISNKGGNLPFNGVVSVWAAPGKVRTATGKTRVRVPIVDGVGQTQLTVENVYGRTHVCVEDDIVHPGDPDQGFPTDTREAPTFSVGCSQTLWFDMPTIRQLQVTDDATTSPLIGSFLEVRSGDLIVTGIFAEGFYVTDLDTPEDPTLPGNFESMFVFNFSYPEGIVVGDRLESFLGTVQEFTGATQVVFPSWVRRDVPRALEDLPEPVVLTDEICAAPTGTSSGAGLCGHSTTNLQMESLEASLVKIERVKMPSNWVNCDLNADGDVSNFDSTCPDTPGPDDTINCREIACKKECNADMTCTEASSLLTYGQWSVAMNEGAGPKINVLTREGFPELDPTDEKNFGKILDITGNLRHSLPARPRWIVVARSGQDVVIYP